jgi:fructan beta-fructosidase
MKTIFLTLVGCQFVLSMTGQTIVKEYKISNQYMNFPIDMEQDPQMVKFVLKKDTLMWSNIRIAEGKADYWVFKDVSAYKGKKLILLFSEDVKGLERIYQDDRFAGQDSLYKETYRPQFHFTTRRGWNNDPNGLVYYDGEYHLFYQHNPYSTNWNNMHWGHAVSKDLLHWEELPNALYPDELGTMYSGSAAVDFSNTSGFQTGKVKPIIAAYTAAGHKQVQCIAYSNDRGRTFTKYEGNPVVDSKEKWNSPDTRDPKIFWHEDSKKWVMVLFEKSGHSIYNSDDLKSWNYQSHIDGFGECPDLFELAVDGDPYNKKWVISHADGKYKIGNFDGQRFTPETEKLNYFDGRIMFAAQTLNNIPESDGRRIQIGWGKIRHPGMPFNQMMLFPTELTLRTTPEGIRMYCEPIEEIEKLHKKSYSWKNLSHEEANEKLKMIESDLLHLKMDIEIISGLYFDVYFKGNRLLFYNGAWNTFNGTHYTGDEPGTFRFDVEILVDKTSSEIYIDNGKLFIPGELEIKEPGIGFELRHWPGRETIDKVKVHSLEIHELKSIW